MIFAEISQEIDSLISYRRRRQWTAAVRVGGQRITGIEILPDHLQVVGYFQTCNRPPRENKPTIVMKLVRMALHFGYRLLAFLVTPDQTYRRRRGKSVWHFSSRCKYWPSENFEEIRGNGPQFGVCPLCMEIEESRKVPSYIP